MDIYSLKDVQRLDVNNRLTKEILDSIFESTTRQIELFDDYQSIEILKYVLDLEITPVELKEVIHLFLTDYENNREKTVIVDIPRKEKIGFAYILIAGLLIFLGMFLRLFL